MTVTNGSGPGALHRSTLILMTAGAALGSAGIHCNQPLLPSMATSFGVAYALNDGMSTSTGKYGANIGRLSRASLSR